ncbi:immunoglobulin superfamily DCC subclass member 4 isoform X1 [Pyxicephalus adspersus]|uniref:immunoglobulin superfamily DCC subclass member 4 isoform X1 n=2 Tax=Pyxicephalus adspersus TaxID=30357 RepID=UPI003B58C940
MALGRLALLWGLHWAGCVLVVAGGKSTWLDLSCHPGPSDFVLLPGHEVIVHCDVGNMGGSTNVTWWKNEEQLNPENLTVLPNGGLLLSSEGSSIQGNYSCLYQNSFGAVKGRTGTIRLAELAPFYMHPDPQIVHQGGLAQFECGISGTPPAQITWQKDQTQLPASKRFVRLPSGVLLISRVQPEDAGLYRCVASNVVNTRYSNEAQLSVEKDLKPFHDELTITRSPQNLTMVAGQSAVMECSAEGKEMPVFSWFRQDGNPLSSDIVLLGESNLLIKHIQSHHAGVYVCRASSAHSQHFVTASAQLQVLVPPFITQLPEIITRARAGTARFICSATGDPEPTITWLKNGQLLSSNGRVRIQPSGSLVITHIDLEDAGYYQCVATNILGSICATTRLHVTVLEGLPGPPQDLRALVVTSKTVTVTWERPQNNWERVIGFSLHYTKTGGSENMEYQFAVNNDTTELNVKYLEPGTNYTFYVVAYSQQGASRASEPLVVQTWDDVPAAAPMLSLNSETAEDIHIKWLPLQPDLTNGHIIKYRIEYTSQKDGVVSTIEVEGNETGLTLSSLQPGTVYKVRISASTSAGYGAPSNWVLQRTPDRVNQTQVEQAQVQLKVIAHTDALFVSWQLPRTDLLITGYRLYYRMVCPVLDPAASCPWQGKNEWDRGPIKLKKKRKQYEITDLIPGQLYQVRLVTYYKKQEMQTVMWEGRTRQIPTAPPDFKSQRIPPLPPSHIQVEPNSSTSVWVKWRKPIISSRIVNYTVRSGPWGAKNASLFTYHSSILEEILITGLKPYTRYEFAVQSNGAGVDGPYSNIVEKMTLPDRPSSPPADLVLQPLSHSSVQVHWRPPLESNGIIIQYLILYTANKSHPDETWTLLTKEGNIFSSEIQDLQSGTKYYFKMGAKTSSGWGPYSNVVEVETLPPRLPDVLDMNSVTGIIVGVCLCLLCLLLCMCASFQQGKQRDSGSELGPRSNRGPSSYQRARQGSCSQNHCQDSHELETLMPARQEDTPSLPVPEITELIGGLVSNPPSEDKNQLKMKTSWNGSVTQNWANHITSYAETIPGELAANGSANHLTYGGIRMVLHDITYESHKVDIGRNHRNPSQNQVEADVIVHSDFSASERSGRCAGLDSEEEEEEISMDQEKGPTGCLTPTSNPHTQSVSTEGENQDWSNQPLVAIVTEQTLNVVATKSTHLANGIPRNGDSQDNQTATGSPFTVDSGDSCSEDVPLTSRAQQELPQSNTPVLPQVINSEETVH